MNIKITMHLMPWEIDHALIVADRLKQNSYNISSENKIYIDTALNLSSLVIDWEKSLIPKNFFIEKYKVFDKILSDKFVHKPYIYDGNDLYGHLDLQKTCLQKDIDYYMTICPDIDFSTQILYYIIESAKQIKNEYFIITPQIFKCWDHTWDILVNNLFMKYNYSQCIDVNIHEIKHIVQNNSSENIEIVGIDTFKYAGWFDLYNKNFYENLVPALDEWKGYGPWDFYSFNICQLAKKYNVDVKQYILKNEVIWFYDTGVLKDTVKKANGEGLLKSVYTKFLVKKMDKTEQTLDIYNNMNININRWIQYANKKGIIKT